ncbi:hypothetical protein V8G54_033953 [Vigna mungo]|uniref:Uncharacterized protein n=1 Tax=Vigna mungo TaxID=3915 RepID=A0AAQ3MPU9_VIGMU
MPLNYYFVITFATQGDIISLERQIRNHGDIYNRIVRIYGNSKNAEKYLGKCVYYLKIGTNDYYDNYFIPSSPTRRDFTPDQYAADLVRRYSSYLKVFYTFLFLFLFSHKFAWGKFHKLNY